MSSHQHRHAQHIHSPRKPIAGQSTENIQPHGNAAAREQVGQQPGEQCGGGWLPATACAVGDAISDWWNGSWWEQFAGAEELRRQEMALAAWRAGEVQDHIADLTEEQTLASYREELGEVLDYVQQLEMMKAAGMTWEEMATSQRTWMIEQARKATGADHTGKLSEEEFQEAHEAQVADQTYYQNTDPAKTEWASFTDEQRGAWRTRARAARSTFVTWASRVHPELGIREDELQPALRRCEELNAVAYAAKGICYFSREVVVAIERNPAYALSTIQHELRGHPEFDTGFSLGMELYDEAASGLPGYTRPDTGTEERKAEWARYDYLESEIGALLRETSYWRGSEDLDGTGAIESTERNPLGNPLHLLEDLLMDMQGNWEPHILSAHLTGLRRRFEADPRVSSAALAAFVSAAEQTLGLTP